MDAIHLGFGCSGATTEKYAGCAAVSQSEDGRSWKGERESERVSKGVRE